MNNPEPLVVRYRRENLKMFIFNNFKGKNPQAAFVRKYDVNQGEISGLLRNKAFGEKKARALEKIIGLPEMSLDKPTDPNGLSVTVPIEKPPITTTFDVPANIKLEICKNMKPSTIEMAYNIKSNNLVTAIYRLMNIGKEQDRLKVLLEINDLIQAEIDMEKYVLEPATPKAKAPA